MDSMSLFPTLFYHDFFSPLETTLIRKSHPTNPRQLKLKNKKLNATSLAEDMKSILQVDLLENENEFQVHADLPGVEEKDLDITIENNHLVIKGHREKKDEMKNATEHRIERSYGSVQRSIRLPPNADQSSCNAHFDNGVLKISLTKVAPHPPANKIKITTKKKTEHEGNDEDVQVKKKRVE
jgi:HSP20 family molecular chaperone IbpA